MGLCWSSEEQEKFPGVTGMVLGSQRFTAEMSALVFCALNVRGVIPYAQTVLVIF